MPKADWSELDDSCKDQPITPSMFRAVGSKDAKSYQFRIKGVAKKLDSTLSTPLNTFISIFMKHMKLHGMDTITYLPDPGDSTKVCSIVTHYTRFKLDNVTVMSKTLYNNDFDDYDKANDQSAQSFLTNSISSELYLEVENTIELDDTFVIMWMKVLQLIHRNTHQFFTGIENQIRAGEPVTAPVCNPGQQMDKWCAHIRRLVLVLYNSGQYDHKLTETIIILAMTAGGDGNEDWLTELRPLKKLIREKITEIAFYDDNKQREEDFTKAGLTPTIILDQIKDHYLSLIDSDDWPPVVNISDASTAPLAKFKSSKNQSAYYTPTSAPSLPPKHPYASAPSKSSTKPSSTSYKSKFNGKKNRRFSPLEK